MKKIFFLCLAMMFILMAVPALAAMPDGVVFDDESTTPDLTVSGYPRFEMLEDGTLLLFNRGTLRKSTDNGETWRRITINQNVSTTVTTSTGTTHELTCENWQGFVCDDGTVIAAYRSHTKGYVSGEFYTSIRFMTSTDDGETFDNEVIVAEAFSNASHGYWEPFMIQTDENTVLFFYSDDLNVNNENQQNIVYHEYNLTTKEIGESVVAINGVNRNSRDGMPVITELRYGGYAMVIETHDYSNRFYGGLNYYNCVFVIGLSLSEDGKTWSAPIPVVAPANVRSGDRAAAPYITTLPDGRVVISYMTEDGYTGERVTDPPHGNCVYGAVISNDVLTTSTNLSATTGGAANGFTALDDVFADPETGYMIWNTVFCDGKYLYFAGSSGTNNGTESAHIKIRRADVSATVVGYDMNHDGDTNLLDVLCAFKCFLENKSHMIDFDNDQSGDISDIISLLMNVINN